jgi:hypothetical protein
MTTAPIQIGAQSMVDSAHCAHSAHCAYKGRVGASPYIGARSGLFHSAPLRPSAPGAGWGGVTSALSNRLRLWHLHTSPSMRETRRTAAKLTRHSMPFFRASRHPKRAAHSKQNQRRHETAQVTITLIIGLKSHKYNNLQP